MSSRPCLLLLNRTAGSGKGATAGTATMAALRSAGREVFCIAPDSAGELSAQAGEALQKSTEPVDVVACGGDGMVHLALQLVAGTQHRLAVIPAGTGNDFASSLGIPCADPGEAIVRFLRGSTRRIDLARSGAKWYATVLAAGFDAVVNERANRMHWPRGQMRYNVATVAALRTFRPLHYTLDFGGHAVQTEAMLVGVANGPSFGGGLRIAHGASLTDGLLDVVVVKPLSRSRMLRVYPQLYAGTHTRLPEFERYRVRSVTVASPGIVSYADGERFGPLPLTITAEPQSLEVYA